MHIKFIKQKLARQVADSTEWLDKLSDAEPGIYGLEDWDVEISEDDVYVNIPERTFFFNDVSFSFNVQLGSSNHEDGFSSDFQRTVAGQGTFEFSKDGTEIILKTLEIKVDLDLFA